MGSVTVQVPAHAKLNLSLRVLYKRLDGFHELRTVFQTIALHDSLDIEYARARTTKVELDSNVEIPNNLVVRAADAVLAELGVKAKVRFRLKKRIPLGGGLAGGSTDAAAVLLALPVLAGRPIAPERLAELAASLGSDVPFFLTGGAALGLGRGEELYALPAVPDVPVLLGCPGVPVSTPEAFRALGRRPVTELTSPGDHPRMKEFQLLVEGVVCPRSAGDWMAFCENDFEAAVFPLYPQLAVLRQSLIERGARLARMSGSGSTLFGLFRSEAARDRAARQLAKDHPNVEWIPTRFIDRDRYRASWRRALGVSRSSARATSGRGDRGFGWIA